MSKDVIPLTVLLQNTVRLLHIDISTPRYDVTGLLINNEHPFGQTRSSLRITVQAQGCDPPRYRAALQNVLSVVWWWKAACRESVAQVPRTDSIGERIRELVGHNSYRARPRSRSVTKLADTPNDGKSPK